MASTYETKQGDTWDLMAYDLYGDEKYMRYLMEANLPLLDIMIFSSGVKIFVPDLPEETDEDLPFWRVNAGQDGEYSSIEDGDEGE
ncbi:tail protein X [Schaedlerella arabinosiphila]|uniref:tail protein X n=1 Tax=Schaedlerella arabinosiphila TaxID=2044587 RepID=UPI002557D513|nr:tail protein X [Schaedlerella arabinosiphila]